MARTQLTLTESTLDLLEKIAEREGKSAYVERLITERWEAWTAALRACEQAGLRTPEVKAICDALNGCYMLGEYVSGGRVALELSDAQELNAIGKKWDVAPKRWTEVIKSIAASGELAHSVGVIVREFWSGNRACEAAIERLGRKS